MSIDPLAILVKKGEKFFCEAALEGSTNLRGSSQSVYLVVYFPVVYFILLFMVIVLCFE